MGRQTTGTDDEGTRRGDERGDVTTDDEATADEGKRLGDARADGAADDEGKRERTRRRTS